MLKKVGKQTRLLPRINAGEPPGEIVKMHGREMDRITVVAGDDGPPLEALAGVVAVPAQVAVPHSVHRMARRPASRPMSVMRTISSTSSMRRAWHTPRR